jgi:futalosine hydrolase
MRILIVAATLAEIKPLLERMPLAGSPAGDVVVYQYNKVTIDVLITGVGMVATSFFTGRQLMSQNYDLAINAGIAGSFNESLPPGSVVHIVKDHFPDMGAEDGDRIMSLFELGLADPDKHPYTGGKLVNGQLRAGVFFNNQVISGLTKAESITSNTVRGSVAGIERIRRTFHADIESMEGAAFFFACMSGHHPCLQLRSVSNMVEVRDKSRWEIALAVKNLNQVLWDLLISL